MLMLATIIRNKIAEEKYKIVTNINIDEAITKLSIISKKANIYLKGLINNFESTAVIPQTEINNWKLQIKNAEEFVATITRHKIKNSA